MSYLSRIAAKAEKMPPMPTVVTKVMELTADPDYSTQELVNTINMDQAITAHVLRKVNSAFFGLRHKVASLDQAVPQLGAQNVAEIALDSAVSQYFKGNESIWRHSMATALVAKELGHMARVSDMPALHTGALLHDVGKLIIAEFVRDIFEEIQHFVNVEGYTYTMAEKEALGIDHAELGGRIAKKWKLAPETVEVIALHHDPAKARISTRHINIVCVASQIATATGYSCETGDDDFGVPPTALFELRMTRRELDGLVVQMGRILANATEIIELAP